MNEPLISVIVPVYKAEDYLEECVESVLHQNYQKFQLILVDDGSPDRCPDLCDEYAKKDDRIEVIHRENGGLSLARNSGLEIAKGEYITFLDSDDMIAPTFLSRMLQVSQKYQVDCVQCGALFGSNRVINGKIDQAERIYNGSQALLHNDIKVRVCGNLYTAQLLRNFRFPNIRIYEDEAVSYRLIYKCKEVVRIDDELYYYFFNINSLSKKDDDYIPDDFIQIYDDRIKFFEEKEDKSMIIRSKERLCRSLIVLYVRCQKNLNNQNDTESYLKMIRHLTREIIFTNIPSRKSKVQCILMSIFPKIGTKFAIKYKLNSRF